MDEQQNNANMGVAESSNGSTGLIIGAIVIVALVVLGGLYFWGQRVNGEAMENELESINMQDTSDEEAAIKADLDATQIENLDAGLNAL